MKFLRLFATFLAVTAWGLVSAGTITVTSPAKGSAANPTPVKGSTQINFNITGGVTQVTVTVRIFRVDTNTLYRTLEPVRVTPDTQGRVSGSATMTFSKTNNDPEIPYRVEVRASEEAGTYNTDQDLFVKPDLTAPKILQYNPLQNSFVKGVVTIRVRIAEENLKDWRVQVNNQDLVNGFGTTVDALGRFTVTWDTSGEQFDGPKTITVRVRDTADSEVTQNIPVTIDRVKPVISILTPQNNATFSAGSTITVVVDVRDFSSSSVAATGVDVVVRNTAGAFVLRVARISFTAANSTTSRWTGRIRWVNGQLPSTFRIHVTAIDKAGNVATPQVVTATIGN